MSSFRHAPVLLAEAIDALQIRPDGTYIDCTAGGGGHSAAIASRLTAGGRLIAIDRDPDAIEAAAGAIHDAVVDRRSPLRPRVDMVHAPFSRLSVELHRLGVVPGRVDGLLADLGVSSPQLDRGERGFSFGQDAPLDMRMDPTSGSTAAELLATLDEPELTGLLRRGGDAPSCSPADCGRSRPRPSWSR